MNNTETLNAALRQYAGFIADNHETVIHTADLGPLVTEMRDAVNKILADYFDQL